VNVEMTTLMNCLQSKEKKDNDDDTTNRALISVLDEFTRQQTTLSVDEVSLFI